MKKLVFVSAILLSYSSAFSSQAAINIWTRNKSTTVGTCFQTCKAAGHEQLRLECKEKYNGILSDISMAAANDFGFVTFGLCVVETQKSQ